MSILFRNYGLSLVLFIFFLSSIIGQAIFQWLEFIQEQTEHGQAASLVSFIPSFLSRTLENWQSEFLQLLTFVILTAYLSHKGSPESKDSDEETKKALDRIEKKLGIKKSERIKRT